MPTRTLGIKFEIAGVKEARNSLEQFRKNLNLSLADNKKAVNQIAKFDSKTRTQRAKTAISFKSTPKTSRTSHGSAVSAEPVSSFSSEQTRKTTLQRTSYVDTKSEYREQGRIIAEQIKLVLSSNEDDFVGNYQKLFQELKQGNVKEGVLQYARKPVNSILAGYYEAIGGEFGARVGQIILGAKSSQVSSFKNRSEESFGNRIIVDLNPQQFKSFAEILKSSFKTDLNNNQLTIYPSTQVVSPEKKPSLVDRAIEPIFLRIQAVSSGYFEGIGNYFGEQFATGLDEVLQEELDISQKRRGRIFGKSISFVANDGLENLEEKFKTLAHTIADLGDESEQVNLEKIKKFIAALVGIPNSLVDSYLTGFRRASVQEEASRKVDSSKAKFNEEVENIEDYERAVLTVSGYAGKQGQQGREQAERLRELNEDDKTIILSSDTPFTDVLFEAKDAASGAAWGVNALANAAKVNLKGFNPDSVALVNKILALREKNPEIKIKIVGHSAGGFVAEEAQYLLELLGKEGIETVTLGTPNLKGGLKPENIRRIFSENDPLEALHQVAELVDFVESSTTEYDSTPEGHFFDQYLASNNVREAIFGRPTQRPTNIEPPPEVNDIARETLYTVGDAVATALETEGSPEERAQAAQEVILNALANYQSRVEAALNEQVDTAENTVGETVAEIETLINNPQLFTERAERKLYDLIETNLKGFFDIALELIASGVDFGLRTYRRQVLADVGQRKVYDRAQEILRENRPRTGARVTREHRQFFATTGGYAGARGRSGARIARSISNQVEDAYVIHVPNRNSDVPATAIQDPEERPYAWASSLGRPNLRGYSPDAIEIAAQALAAHLRNPEIEIKIVGESGGGYLAEEAVHLLNLLGVPKVSGIAVGNPNLIGGINANNFTRILSPDEPVGREAHEFWARYYLADVSDPNQNIPGIEGHPYEYYENTPQLQDFILGQPGLTSRGRGRRIRDISQQFLTASTQEMNPAQRDDLIAIARSNLTQVQRRIPQATGESLEYLQEAERNFQDFFEVLTDGSERLENYRSLLIRARNEIDQRTERPTPENLTYLQGINEDIALYREQYRDLAQTDDAKRFAVIDRELEQLQTGIDEFVAESLATPRREIKRKYQQYLRNKSRMPQAAIDDFIQERRQDYQGLDRRGKQEYITSIQRGINSRIQDYRQAINNNNLQLARNIADSILPQINLIKEVYKDIASSLPAEDSLRNSIAGIQGYLTSVQTEIIQGSNAPGRINVGLPDILEREIELAQTGENAALAFIGGIINELDRAEAAGEDLGEALQEGTDDNLDIRSPSREFIRRGIEVVNGLIIGLRNRFDDVRDTGEELGEELTEGVERHEEPNLLNKIKSWFGELETNFPLLKKYKGLIGGILAGVLGLVGINIGVSALTNLAGEALATAMAVESLNKAIVFTSRNSAEGVKNLAFVTAEAKKLKVDITEAKQAYAGLIGAAKGTSLEGQQVERIFSAFAASAANRGVDIQGQQRLFTALEQIIAKRRLQAEEVKGQIGDIRGFGDFQNIIAQAQGVSTSELLEQMQRGEIGLDVLPKVAAILEAQNAAADSTETAVQAQTRYNNALTEFKTLFGGMLQPFQKFIYNILAGGLDLLTVKFVSFAKILVNLVGVALIALLGHFRILPILIQAIRLALVGLINALSSLWAILPGILAALARFIAAYALVAGAIATVSNLIKLSKNQYQELNDEVDKLTETMEAYTIAVEEAVGAQNKLKASSDLKLNEGWQLPDNWFGNILRPLVGGDRVNLDNIIRRRFGFTTEAERRQADFQVASSDFQFATNNLLVNPQPAIDAAEEISKFDKLIREIQSKRLELLPGDEEALKESLEAERAISKERDKQLKILSLYQQSLQSALTLNQKFIDELDTKYAKGEISPEVYEKERASLAAIQEDTKDKLEGINNIVSKVSKTLSEFQRELRNSSERVKGFIENRGRQAQQERIQVIEEGLANQEGERVIQLKLDKINRSELRDNIREIERAIAASTRRLQSGALAEGYKLVQESAEKNNLPLTTDTIERMLQEERSSGEKDALGELKLLRELQTQLYQNQEQLAQNLQQNRSNLIDFNRTLNDYFFRLTQEIKEARVEVERLINQLFYGNIKSRLKSAIAPGTESFLNGIIEGVQGVIDHAASIAEKVLGQDSALIGFETKQYDLQTQLQDFARQIAGASDAVLEFARRLRGNTGTRGSGDTGRSTNNIFAEGKSVAKKALTWQGKHFKKGVYAMCAGFVRQILKEAGVNVGVTKNPYDAGKQPNNGELMARSFFGSDVGTVFKDPSQAQPGDIIGFFDTYQYGQKPGAITHVGVYTGNGMMVDRSTSSKPVNHRSIDTFGKGNYIFVRPHQYQTPIQTSYGAPVSSENGVINTPTKKNSISNTSDILNWANSQVQERLNIEADKIDLQGMGIELDLQNLGIDIEQLTGKNARTFETQAREAERAAQSLRDRFTNIGLENQLPTAEGELEKNLINARSQFKDFDSEIFQQLQRLTDFVRSAERFIQVAPTEIQQLRNVGTPEATQAADFIQNTVDQTVNALPGYLELIEEIANQQESLPKIQRSALQFIEEQGRLKIEQQELGKQNVVNQLRLNIATARGTNEERRQLEIAAERLRLEERINQIKQQYGNSEYARKLIEQERRNSQIREEEINRDAEGRDLSYEQQLINLQSGIKEKQASILDDIGATVTANRLRREAAIAQEMQRYKQEIAELEKTYAGEPEKLKKLKEEAKKLNQVNLAAIKQQFKSLAGEIKKLAYNATENFFTNLLTNLFEGQEQKQQQILEANLDYAQKLNEAYEKFKNNPAELAQAKNRLKELNNQKLDGIREEFNLFNRVVNFAKQALSEFFKGIAQMMAKKVTAGIFKFIGGLGLGFADGGTVPNFATGGTVDKNYTSSRSWGNPNRDALNRIVSPGLTSVLSKSSKPIRSAFSREGNKGVLAVFTPGEEILSLKTGEAQRYQALKRELGINPLQEIFAGNFANGGTVEGNLLSNIGTRPSFVRFDSGSLNRGTTNNITRSGTVNINVTTPNADSFRASEHQLGLDAAESLRRSMKRN